MEEEDRFMAALAKLDSESPGAWLLFINAGFSMATAKSLFEKGMVEATIQMGMPAARPKRAESAGGVSERLGENPGSRGSASAETPAKQGLKRCTFCEEWKAADKFAADATRWDGKTAGCFACRNDRAKEVYDPVSALFRLPSGPERIARRNGDKLQAKARINSDVELGLRPNPNNLFCAKCGHKGSDRRHEYHHVMGYEEMHHYDVLPLCSRCHHEEHPRHGKQNKN